ncbi:MAG: hypothetical protein Pg6C_19030 [Treponemataceae bacterium]|nr:MAG: hypothetical protein Pg6C_18680 [Treponemataceae bacterium]GMO53000.1 MAG: hypothetical protein Pg6C_19030 [Treponemataceae bacterium]
MVDKVLEQVIDSRLDKRLVPFRDAIQKLNERNIQLDRDVSNIKIQIEKLQKMFDEFAYEIKTISSRIEKFEKPEKPDQTASADIIISKFNSWASNPFVPLPQAFSFLAGEFRIRTSRQLQSTPEETGWITNREGLKKYLLPNPNSFNQMTNILELYEMDQNMLKEKGKNKIKIITPCEMANNGFINMPGKLQILP